MMRIVAVVTSLAAFSSITYGQPTEAEKAACKADYSRFCSGVIPGGGRVLVCLKKYYKSLAPKCRAVVDAH